MNNFNVEDYFSHDHDELDGVFKDFQRLKSTDYEAAKESFRKFKSGLQQHIAWEEQILFPLFEQATGMKETGPTAVMREEHCQIKAALEAIHKKLQFHDLDSGLQEAELVAVLQFHNQKEESVLYPAIDQIVSVQDRLAAYERMKHITQDANKSCCHIHPNQ